MTLAHRLRRGARAILGVDFQRHDAHSDQFLRLAKILAITSVELVLDVGANDGGYGSELLAAGYAGKVLSFEPIPDARERLLARSLSFPGQWEIAPPLALSDEDSSATFNIAGNSVSSSLLEMTDTHVAAAPGSATAGQINVTTRRLDSLWPALGAPERCFLKLDTQGSERMVLEGAGDLLRGPIVGLQLEMSLGTLYRGQVLAHDLDAYVRSLGFVLWDLVPGFRDPKSMRMLQYDGIYMRQV